MRQLLLIDCRTLHIARYNDRKQASELAKLMLPIEDMPRALERLDAFRRHGHAGLDETTRPPEAA